MQLKLPRGSVYLAAAVLAGLVATFAVHRYISVKTHIPVVATRSVVVATGDISPGTALSGQQIKTVSWPNGVIPPKSAASVREVEGRVVKVPISQGNPVLFSMLAPQGTAAGLSGILDEGRRALTVKVDEVAGVAGFIHPGDHVDVLVDLPVREATDHFSKTILHDITVLSTGQIWEQKGDSKPVVVNTVTLELTPDDSEVLNLASNEGKIRLALRNRNSRTIAETKGVTTSMLTHGVGRKEAKVEVPKPIPDKSVEVIKGLDRTEAKL
ncbi:MAG: Flp pilus assembly protein CpaB [Desulfobaccales bacterium]